MSRDQKKQYFRKGILPKMPWIQFCLMLFHSFRCYPPKTNMIMENPPFEDVFPVETGMFQCHVSFQRCVIYDHCLPVKMLDSLRLQKISRRRKIMSFLLLLYRLLAVLAKPLSERLWHQIKPEWIAILGGGFKHFLCSPLRGEMIQFD